MNPTDALSWKEELFKIDARRQRTAGMRLGIYGVSTEQFIRMFEMLQQ
jgi:hypothetical protein